MHDLLYFCKDGHSLFYTIGIQALAEELNHFFNSKSWKLVFRGFPYMGMFD